MVRTLVFHTNNVGSIPTGLNIHNVRLDNTALHYFNNSKLKTSQRGCGAIRYSFRFASIIAPSTSLSFGPSHSNPYAPLPKRLLLKRSYLILSWMYYLSLSGTLAKETSNLKPRFSVLPSRRSRYTLTKAPMAHKTRSKEQFLFQFYYFKFSFKAPIAHKVAPGSPLEGANALEMTRQLFPIFETNMLFLKMYDISYPVRVKNFLTSF